MRTLILALLLLFAQSPHAGASPVMTDRLEGSLPVLSFASWLQDATGEMGITEASAPAAQSRFVSLRDGFPATASGAGWLRLELAKTPPAQGVLPKYNDNQLFLKLGALPPGTATIYYQNSLDPVKAPGFWYTTALRPYEDAPLPDPPLSGTVVYIHFEETPGLWFSPALARSGDESPFMVPPDLVLPGILLAGIIVCLLRAIKDKALWPVWAALMLGLVLVQVLLPLPVLRKRLDFVSLPPMLAPGLCLMIFPHLGRLMLNTRSYSSLQDSLLKVTPVIGVILSLAPLVPGYGWLTRLFPLWPLFLIPLLPFCLSALSRKRPGALVYTGACLLPVIGACWALWCLFSPEVHPLAAYGGLWGLAIGGLFLFLARVPKEEAIPSPEENAMDIPGDTLPPGDDDFPFSMSSGASAGQPFSDQADMPAFTGDEASPALEEALPAPFSPVAETPSAKEVQALPLRHLFHEDDEDTPPSVQNGAEENTSLPEESANVEDHSAKQSALEEATRKYGEPGAVKPSFESFGGASSEAASKATPSFSASAKGTYGGMAALFNEGPEPAPPAPVREDGTGPSEAASDNAVALDSFVDVPDAPAPGVPPSTQGAGSFVPDTPVAQASGIGPASAPSPAPAPSGWSGSLAASFMDDDTPPADAPAGPSGPSDANREPVSDVEVTEAQSGGPRVISLEDEDVTDPDWQRQASLFRASIPAGEGFVFSLHGLVRDVHDAAMPLAEDKGILLSWFISPSLPSFLEGDAASLRQALSLLLQNAVQATQKGAVQLFVRHDPAAAPTEHGSLQFTVSDTGAAQRADAGFFHAWELAQRTGGSFSIEYSVTGGTLVVFSVNFTLPSEEMLLAYRKDIPNDSQEHALSEEQTSFSHSFPLSQQLLKSSGPQEETVEEEPLPDAGIDASVPRFIITDMTTSNKRLLSHYLSDIPHVALESKNMDHAVELVRRTNPAIVIYDADAPEDAIIATMRKIAVFREQQGLPLLPQLVIAGHEAQAKRMQNGSATHVLLKPFTPEALLELLHGALPTLEENPAPPVVAEEKQEPSPPRVRVYLQNSGQKAAFAGTGVSVTAEEKTAAPASAESETANILPGWADEATPVMDEVASPAEQNEAETPSSESAASPAAPLLHSLSEEDVAPSDGSTSLMDLFITDEEQEPSSGPRKEAPLEMVEDGAGGPIAGPSSGHAPVAGEGGEENAAPLSMASAGPSPAKQNPSATAPRPETPSRPSTISVVEPVVVNLSGGGVTTRATPLVPVEPKPVPPEPTAPVGNGADGTDGAAPQERKSSVLEEAGDMLFGPAPTGSYPLPGMGGEALEVVMLPLVPGLLHTLNDALADSIKARDEHQTIFVQEAVSRLAGKAEVFGMERLGKIARCVERAAEADDFEAVDTLLDDLIAVTQRYIDSLKACYDSFVNEAR